MTMQYREFLPAPDLADDVECFWMLEGYDAPSKHEPERLLPDGCVELILNLGDAFREIHHGGAVSLQPTRFVVGQMTRPVLVTPVGAVRLFGIRFAPGGTIPFLDERPSELTNRIVALDEVALKLERGLSGRLDPTARPEALVAAASLALGEVARRHRERGTSLRPALNHLVRAGGRTSIDRLALDLGMSGRQMERRFLESVGLGPKLLMRILRFQQVFQAVERANVPWAGIAAECGYYDQSHLIRDFRQFAGETPAALIEELSRFGEYFTRKHRASVSSNTAWPH